MVLVKTAIMVMIASNYKPFLLKSATTQGMPNALVTMTMAAMRKRSGGVKLP